MSFTTSLFGPTLGPLQTMATLVALMAILALLEVLIPLQPHRHLNRSHLGPNLTLTLLTFATNLLFNGALLATLAWLEARNFGLLAHTPLPSWLTAGIMILGLDFSYYVAHVSMHKVPGFWRFHRVHHSDAAVDVTTTIRQHPGEGVIRYLFMAAVAIPLGVSTSAFALYRLWSAVSGLLEHANLGLPPWLDQALSVVFTWPNLHKIHHSRDPRLTDTNYSNMVSLWDRLGGTFTPASHGSHIAYGLDGFDDPQLQTITGLLALPFRTIEAELVAGPPISAAPRGHAAVA